MSDREHADFCLEFKKHECIGESGEQGTPDLSQAVETVRQRRSRIVQTLNVPQRVRLGPSLAAALLDGLFEHPAGVFFYRADRADH